MFPAVVSSISLQFSDQDLDLPIIELPDEYYYFTPQGKTATENTQVSVGSSGDLYDSLGNRAWGRSGAVTHTIFAAYDKDGNSLDASMVDQYLSISNDMPTEEELNAKPSYVSGPFATAVLSWREWGSDLPAPFNVYKIAFYEQDHSLD